GRGVEAFVLLRRSALELDEAGHGLVDVTEEVGERQSPRIFLTGPGLLIRDGENVETLTPVALDRGDQQLAEVLRPHRRVAMTLDDVDVTGPIPRVAMDEHHRLVLGGDLRAIGESRVAADGETEVGPRDVLLLHTALLDLVAGYWVEFGDGRVVHDLGSVAQGVGLLEALESRLRPDQRRRGFPLGIPAGQEVDVDVTLGVQGNRVRLHP